MKRKKNFNELSQKNNEVKKEKQDKNLNGFLQYIQDQQHSNNNLTQEIQKMLSANKSALSLKIKKQQTKKLYFANLINKTLKDNNSNLDLQLFIQEHENNTIKSLLNQSQIQKFQSISQEFSIRKQYSKNKFNSSIKLVDDRIGKSYQKIHKLKHKINQSKLSRSIQLCKKENSQRIRQLQTTKKDKIRDIIDSLNKQRSLKNKFYQDLVNRIQQPQSVKNQKKIQKQIERDILLNQTQSQNFGILKFQQKMQTGNQQIKKKRQQIYKESKGQIPKFVELKVNFNQQQKKQTIEAKQNLKVKHHINFDDVKKFEKDYLQKTFTKFEFKQEFIKKSKGEIKFKKTLPNKLAQSTKISEQFKQSLLRCNSQGIRKKIKQDIYSRIIKQNYPPKATMKSIKEFQAVQRKLNWKKIQDQQLEEQRQKNLEQIPNYMYSIEEARDYYYQQELLKPRYSVVKQDTLQSNISNDELEKKLQQKRSQHRLSQQLKKAHNFKLQGYKSQFQTNQTNLNFVDRKKLQITLKKKSLNNTIKHKNDKDLLKDIKNKNKKIKALENFQSIKQQKKKDHFSAYLGLAKQKLQLLKNILQINKNLCYFLL